MYGKHRGPVADISCRRCGDGPLLAGDIANTPNAPNRR